MKDPGWRESVIQRSQHRQKRCGGRGAGAVMATGSYEGYLSTEDTLDQPQAAAFTSRRRSWSGGSFLIPTRISDQKKGCTGTHEGV